MKLSFPALSFVLVAHSLSVRAQLEGSGDIRLVQNDLKSIREHWGQFHWSVYDFPPPSKVDGFQSGKDYIHREISDLIWQLKASTLNAKRVGRISEGAGLELAAELDTIRVNYNGVPELLGDKMFEIPDVGILTQVKKDVVLLQEALDEFHVSLPSDGSDLDRQNRNHHIEFHDGLSCTLDAITESCKYFGGQC